MTNALTNHGTAQTRTSGNGSEVRGVAIVGRDQRALFACLYTGKRLHAVQPPAGERPDAYRPAGSLALASTSAATVMAMSRPRWQSHVDVSALVAVSVDLDLPAAAWASLVISRAISA